MFTLRKYQAKGVDEARDAIRQGFNLVTVVSPTGGGKTILITIMAEQAAIKKAGAVIYTNRRILLEQASETMSEHGVLHGIMAAGHDHQLSAAVQIASIDTIRSRVHGSGEWDMPTGKLVIIDEIHRFNNATGRKVIQWHLDHGCKIIGFTATPIGIEPICQKLVESGTYSELINDGFLVPCKVYAPSEVDMKGVAMRGGEYVVSSMARRVRETNIIGDVIRHYRRLNFHGHPALLFAPDVATSQEFCKDFNDAGVNTAHIDGTTPKPERDDIKAQSKAGKIEIVCNCEVLTYGVNWPWIEHGILLHVCGGLTKYLQICGRMLRAYKGKTTAVLQDHTGAFWRHGPPDIDREWNLFHTDDTYNEIRKQRLESGEEKEHICCPDCGGIRDGGKVCPFCGKKHTKSIRKVISHGGQLKIMPGPAHKKKKGKTSRDLWNSELFAGASRKKPATVRQCRGMFFKRNGYWPPDSLMPEPSKFGRRVTEVYPWIGKWRDARKVGSR